MRFLGAGKWILTTLLLAAVLGAAPAAPSFYSIERTIESVRQQLAKPGGPAQPNAPGWNAFFDALLGELRGYNAAADENARLAALSRTYQMSTALAAVSWGPAQTLREELRAWLRPRVRLAWAERRLVGQVKGLRPAATPAAESNRERWVEFVGRDLAEALRGYEAATTVAERQDGLKRLYGALNALQARNQASRWVPSVELEAALNDLYNVPNLDISADVGTLAPALSHEVVEPGPIYRKGYVSMVTPGARTGFGLLPSDQGLAFYNSQMATSVTPIHDFQNQIASDRQGRRAAKMYYFTATSVDNSHITVTAVLTPNGLLLGPSYQHNVNLLLSSFKQRGGALGRFVASLLGFNQSKITQKVYEGALPRMRENVVKEAAELGAERTAQAQAEQNARLAEYLLFGRDAVRFRNLILYRLSLRSRPENALIGGTLNWLGASEQVGADAPQPGKFAVPDSGVSADLHLSSIMTSLTRGYLQSEAARAVNNLVIITKNAPANAPPAEKAEVRENVDFPGYLKAVAETRGANDPKVMAVRVKRPSQPPEFAADARGYLVALVHDFQLEVPAPASAAAGGIAGPAAQVYRIASPRAEFVISFQVTSQTQAAPVHLTGKIESFDPGPNAKVFAINEDESKAQPLTTFAQTILLGVMKTRVQQNIDIPLSNLQLRGFAIRQVSPLEPSGWIRVNLVRTSASPAAGIQ